MTVSELTVLQGIEVPQADGYSRTSDGLFVPESNSHVAPPNTIEVCENPSMLPDMTRASPDKREAYHLWVNPAAALNRVIAESELDGLRATFGNLNDFTDLENILTLLNKEETTKSFEKIFREYYQLVERVNEKIDDSVLGEPGVWDFLKLMSDHLMIQSNMSDLPMSDSLLTLAERGLSTDKPPRKLLDYLSNFDIPKELADHLLDRIDVNPNHPLYWWIASKSPDHPTVAQQREAVEGILNDTTAITAITEPVCLMPFGALLGNATKQRFPKTGLELEANCPVSAVKVPDGTKMGLDAAYGIGGILELRLDDKSHPDVLEYGPSWLHRYFEVWRWEQIVRSPSSSIHVHSDGQDPLKSAYANVMFGDDYDDCGENSLGTIEMRTALSGYVGDSDETGFPELPHPALIELLHLCETPYGSAFALAKARIELTAYGSRIATNPEEIVLAKVNDSINNLNLACIPLLTGEHLVDIVEGIIKLNDSTNNYNLIKELGNLNPELQKRIVEYILNQNAPISIESLLCWIGCLGPDLQQRIFDHIQKAPTGSEMKILVSEVGSLTPELQPRVIDYTVGQIDRFTTFRLIRQIGTIEQEAQKQFVDYILAQNDRNLILRLTYQTGDLVPACQNRVVDYVMAHNDREMTIDLAGQIGTMESETQDRVLDCALAQDDISITFDLISQIGYLEPASQERVVVHVLAQNNRATTSELARVIGRLSPELQKRVLEHGLKTNNFEAVHNFVSAADSPEQSLLVCAVDYLLAKNDSDSIYILSERVDSLDPELQHRVAEALRQHNELPICTPYNIGRRLG